MKEIRFYRLKKWLHDVLRWGFPYKDLPPVGGDSFQPLYQCKFCSMGLAKDSQGNWFHIHDYD